MEFKSVYVHPTQGEVKETDGEVKTRSDLDELLGMSTVSLDFDVSSVEGEDQLQTVPATSASPERFFSSVGLVQTDLCGSLLDTTMIDLMWVKQTP